MYLEILFRIVKNLMGSIIGGQIPETRTLSPTEAVLEWLKAYYKKNNLPIQEYNLIGIRDTTDIKNDVINDYLGFWTDDKIFIAKGTTDPSVHFTLNKNDRNKNGTFHLDCGWHERIWIIGKHQNQYKAFVNRWDQCLPTRGWRDANFNFERDPSDIAVKDYVGINLHRMSLNSIATTIGRHSAGCQVVQDPKKYNVFFEVAESTEMFKQNNMCAFNYMLFNIKDLSPFIIENIKQIERG